MRGFLTGLALFTATALVGACSSDISTATSSPGSSQFELARVGSDTLPSLDSGDSVASNGNVEYREIYLERGALTLVQNPQPRFESLLHFAQYAVTPTAGGGRRLDLRAVADFRDQGAVAHDAQGNLLLTSDLDPSVVHVASAANGGYTVQYRFSSITQPIVLFFRPHGMAP
jgi:hypothetical protein